MISSTNFSSKPILGFLGFFFAFIIGLPGCTKTDEAVIPRHTLHHEKTETVAVLPVYNASGAPVPLNIIQQMVTGYLKRQGVGTLDKEVLEKFLSKYRIRYTGGLDDVTAQAFRRETGVSAALLNTVELYSDIPPPKFAITSRLVSTGKEPAILWMGDTGVSGDDRPGFLGVHLITYTPTLLDKAIASLSTSLTGYLSGKRQENKGEKARKKFRPKVFYRSPILTPGAKYKVAVVPFFNLSEGTYAGEIMALHFVKRLTEDQNFYVIEPGVVRRALLELRIIMDDGLSLAQAEVLFRKLNVDLILTGKVLTYQDYQGFTGAPKVDFSALVFERKSREVVWSSKSYNDGDDGVFFFDWGKVNTAHAMASEMVQSVVALMSQ